MDIPRLKGVPYLEPGTPIYPADLDAWEKKAGLKVTSGDVLFIRTGRWPARDEKGPWDADQKAAGLDATCAKWLRDRDVAMIGSDAALDVRPSGVEGNTHPIHQLVLIAMGTPIFDNCDLEAVAEEAARQNRWEFLLTAAPLAVPGATGSPLNPLRRFRRFKHNVLTHCAELTDHCQWFASCFSKRTTRSAKRTHSALYVRPPA